MNRDQAEELLNARLDGEIDVSDEERLEELLRVDPTLVESWSSLEALEGNLRDAFRDRMGSGQKLGEQTIRELRTRGRPGSKVVRHVSFAALAAGFLIAFILIPFWSSDPPTLAQVALTTGPLEVWRGEVEGWSPIEAGSTIVSGARLRTLENTLCEIDYRNGAVLRLAGSTQLTVSEEEISMRQGRLWCKVPGISLEISTPHGRIQGYDVELDLTCSPEAFVIAVLEGSADVESVNGVATVESRHRLAGLSAGQLGDPEPIEDPILDTRWIHEILRRKGEGSPELASRVRSLLQQIEKTPLYEAEIRSIGNACGPLIAEYVESLEAGERIDRRRRAAELLADLASVASIPALIGLLDDADGEVRGSATRALCRITGRDFGADSSDSWRHWWETRK